MTRTVRGQGDPRWKGAEVESQPGDQAERAADRAEGNERLTAEEESHRLESPHADAGERPPVKRAGADPEGKIAEAAEEHRAPQADRGQPPRGKL